MKKFIATAIAAGAMAVGGAASAQDLGSVIANVLGFGQPTYNYGYGYPNTYPNYNYGNHNYYGGTPTYPAVVAQPYGNSVYVDPYGRQVHVQPNATTTYHAGYDAYGRPIYRDGNGNITYIGGSTSGNYAYSNRSWDRDGDGIANNRDRWPDDRRYY